MKLSCATEFSVSAAQYLEIKQQINELEAKRKELAVELESYLQADNNPSVFWNGMICSVRHSHTASKIDERLLLENGVPQQTIIKSTAQGKEYSFFDMRAPQTKGGGQ